MTITKGLFESYYIDDRQTSKIVTIDGIFCCKQNDACCKHMIVYCERESCCLQYFSIYVPKLDSFYNDILMDGNSLKCSM